MGWFLMDETRDLRLNEFKLTDLIDVDKLQKLQDSFSEQYGIAASTLDKDGIPVTKDSNLCDFCLDYCKKSEEGKRRCAKCDKEGAIMALDKGGPVSYYCHAGLIDFAAPIILRGRMIGSIVGGQVLSGEPDLDKMLNIAEELGIEDKSGFMGAAMQVKRMSMEEINRAAHFIYQIADFVSEMAYKAYEARVNSLVAQKYGVMKADFLANMSHEIRTPMNAVIGMANLALREELPDQAREYVRQIVGSGKILLAIINDILDFSKIEAGKMDIVVDEYEPMSLIHDISNIVLTRIGEKSIELVLDINPDIPVSLIGDVTRVKQILINLANNAVKFTESGAVTIHIDFEYIDEDTINLQCSVEDTGIGIKKENLNSIFESFSQVDSKRNRNIEGTGLGLAISQRLLNLMGGSISVESEYGKGSTFSVTIPQTVSNRTKSAQLDNKNYRVGIYIKNPYRRAQSIKDLRNLGVEVIELPQEYTAESIGHLKLDYLFVEQKYFDHEMFEFAKEHQDVKVSIMCAMGATTEYELDNIRVIRQPFLVLGLVAFLKDDQAFSNRKAQPSENMELFFTAPTAKILLVDDNEINLTVAQGLLEPLKMHIDTALSGKSCIEKIQKEKYDIIFMDHMMPEMDGIETTRLIRRMIPEYEKVPIIAFTANVVTETRTMFYEEGMSDFIGKPIDMTVMLNKLKKWLPKEKIILSSKEYSVSSEVKSGASIDGFDTAYAVKLLGNEALFWEILEDYYEALPEKFDVIRRHKNAGDISAYTIEVHSLKSTSRQVGALGLAKLAEELEMAGKENNIKFITDNTDKLIEVGYEHIEKLRIYFESEKLKSFEKIPVDSEKIKILFSKMLQGLEELDMSAVEEGVEVLERYEFDLDHENMYLALSSACSNMDIELCQMVIEEWSHLFGF